MARIPVECEAVFSTLLTSIIEDTVTASVHWRLHKDLQAAVPEFAKELNQSPAFWSLTLNAHREVALFRLSRLYDKQAGALSLPSLLDIINANLQHFDEGSFRERLKDNPFVASLAQGARRPDAATLKRDAESVAERSCGLVERLLVMRDRVLAHTDPRVVIGAV